MSNGYEATEQLRKVWAVELDLLEKFKQICSKYGLRYCATGGTLLGAVRHGGFIPWDDDIDVALMWPDYMKLLEVAPRECSYPYFFQSYLTEKEAEVSACRLRRSDTTGFTRWEHDNISDDSGYNRGIFIDIFPLFYVPDDAKLREFQREKVLYYWKCIRGFNAYCQIKAGKPVSKDYIEYLPLYESVRDSMSIEMIKAEYLNACALVSEPQAEIGATASRVHQAKLMWKTEWYEPYSELPFENTTISVPNSYEEVLEKQYGDWRTPVKDGAMHEMFAADPDIPWETYFG